MKKLSKEEVLKTVEKSGYKLVSEYKNNKTKLLLECPDGHEYACRFGDFKKGTRCSTCSGRKKKTTSMFKEEVGLLVGNEYEVEGGYANSKTKIKIRHKQCGSSFEMQPNSFLSGQRCPHCSKNKQKITEDFKSDVFDIVGNAYTVVGEYRTAKDKVTMKHNVCGYEFEVQPAHFLHSGTRCHRCTSSYGEGIIELILHKNQIKYSKEKKFSDCIIKKPLPFDFAIYDQQDNLIFLIEYDGEQHFYETGFGKYEYTSQSDAIKNKYCCEQKIDLLRISFKDKKNIFSILQKHILSTLGITIKNPSVDEYLMLQDDIFKQTYQYKFVEFIKTAKSGTYKKSEIKKEIGYDVNNRHFKRDILDHWYVSKFLDGYVDKKIEINKKNIQIGAY